MSVNKNVSRKQTFQFTRHAQSCNNISNVLDKVFEPSITYLGIKQSIEFAKKKAQINAFKQNKVCVSNLLRTWITAVLLYGSQLSQMNPPDNDALILYVCPYLKEYTTKLPGMETLRSTTNSTVNKYELQTMESTVDTVKKLGNQIHQNLNLNPKSQKEMKGGVRTYLDTAKTVGLRTAKQIVDSIPYQIKMGNWPENFAVSLNRFLRFLNNGSKYDKEWFDSLPQTFMFVLPGSGVDGWAEQQRQIIVITKQPSNQYAISQYCKDCKALDCKKKIDDTIGDKSIIPGYLEDGNLQTFMEWYEKSGLDISDKNNKIHVVTHSNVMKGYFKQEFTKKLSPSAVKTVVQRIKSMNVCRFVTSIKKITVPKIIDGVEIDKKLGKTMEETVRSDKLSLCGPDGAAIKARPICGEKKLKTALIHKLLNTKSKAALKAKTMVRKAARGTMKRILNPFGKKKTRKIKK